MTRFVLCLCLLLAVIEAAPKRKKTSPSDGKIVGGTETDISSVPYQVSLQYRNRHICGGSVISSRHILTAAHCVPSGRASDYSIRAGSNFHATGGETRRVRRITKHPKYNPSTVNNDAAVLELDEPLRSDSNARIMTWNNKYRGKEFNNDAAVVELEKPLDLDRKIQIVNLAESEPRTGEQVLISGWGATREGGGATRTLQSTTVPVISRQTCQRAYMRVNTVTDSMFCAGYQQGGRDSCQGDSGGPAVVNGRQAGIVSWGAGCARRNSPGVYTNVAAIRPWIVSQTRTRSSTRKGQ